MKHNLSKIMLLIAVIFMDMLGGMEFDLFVASFPEIQQHFGLSTFWVEALLSINFIGYCLGLFFVGTLADQYGRKPVIVGGLLIFVLGSILCLVTSFYPMLLMGRFLQGVGVAAPVILSFLIIADSYSFKAQQSLLAMLNAVMNVSVAAAPVIGSYITLHFHWEGNFIALLALGLFTLFITTLFLPAYPAPAKTAAFIEKTSLSWKVYLPLFQSRSFLLLLAHIVLSCVPYWIFVGMSPLLYMQELGVTLAHFGYYQGSLALIFALGSLCFGFIISRTDSWKMLKLSVPIFAIACAVLLWGTWNNALNPLWITLWLVPFVIAQIIPITILYPLCLNFFPESKGRIAALMQGLRLMLTAIGLQLTSLLYQGGFREIGLVILFFAITAGIALVMLVRDPRTQKTLVEQEGQ